MAMRMFPPSPELNAQLHGLGAFPGKARDERRPEPLKAGFAAQRAKSRLIGNIPEVGAIGMSPAAAERSLERRKSLFLPALRRPNRGCVRIEPEWNRAAAAYCLHRGIRLLEQA